MIMLSEHIKDFCGENKKALADEHISCAFHRSFQQYNYGLSFCVGVIAFRIENL